MGRLVPVSWMIVALAGCRDHDTKPSADADTWSDPDTALDSTTPSTGSTGDTGSPPWVVSSSTCGAPPPPVERGPCPEGPCVADLASARWTSTVPWAGAGQYGLTLTPDRHLLVDQVLQFKPSFYPYGSSLNPDPTAAVLDLPALGPHGSWYEPANDSTTLFSNHMAAAAFPDGDRIAVSAPRFYDKQPGLYIDGAVYVFHGLPECDANTRADDDATLILHGKSGNLPVNTVLFGSFDGTGAVDLVVDENIAFPNSTDTCTIYAVDPDQTGEQIAADVARRAIRGGPEDKGFGVKLASWDGDGDGLQDLLASTGDIAVSRFESPWIGDLTADDADDAWTVAVGGTDLAYRMTDAGDLDGDGLTDLALGAFDTSPTDQLFRAGATYVVRGGDLGGGDVSGLPIQFVGDHYGGQLGTGLASADMDGDGQTDLVIGEMDGNAPLPGKVLVFRGPLTPGTYGPSDADAVVYGEAPGERFAGDLVAAEVDGDGQADLIVSAAAAANGYGSVYLVPGAALFP